MGLLSHVEHTTWWSTARHDLLYVSQAEVTSHCSHASPLKPASQVHIGEPSDIRQEPASLQKCSSEHLSQSAPENPSSHR